MTSAANPTLAQHATRERLKHRAVQIIRASVDAVPATGSVLVFIRSDHRALDAIMTLSALGHKPEYATRFVDRARLPIDVYLRCLSAAVSAELIGFITMATGPRS